MITNLIKLDPIIALHVIQPSSVYSLIVICHHMQGYSILLCLSPSELDRANKGTWTFSGIDKSR